MAFDIFISHSSKDKVIADAICAGLESRGIRCWIAPRDIPPGSDWPSEIVNAISACKAFVLVFSKNSNDSSQAKRELDCAVKHEKAIVPFRIEKIEPDGSMEYYLGHLHWLDALTPPLADHIEKLSEHIQSILGITNRGRASTAEASQQAGPIKNSDSQPAGGDAAGDEEVSGLTPPVESAGTVSGDKPNKQQKLIPKDKRARNITIIVLACVSLVVLGLAGFIISSKYLQPTQHIPAISLSPSLPPISTSSGESAGSSQVAGLPTATNRVDPNFVAFRTTKAPVVDGSLDVEEWNSAKSYNVDFTIRQGGSKTTILYFMHDEQNLYLGVDSGYLAGSDTRFSLSIDGNRDQILDGKNGLQPVDFLYGISSPGGLPIYNYFAPLPAAGEMTLNPPSGFLRASGVNNGSVQYEFQIPLTALAAGPGDVIGIFFLNGGGTGMSLFGCFPGSCSYANDPTKWDVLLIE